MRRTLFACTASLVLLGVTGCEDVLTPIGDPVDLTYRPCAGASSNPSWFAVQDGDGDWQRVNETSGAYNFTIASGRGGFALFSSETGLVVRYATTEELQSLLGSCTGSVRDVTGTVTGYGSADRVRITVGIGNDEFNGSGFPAPTFWGVGEVDPSVTDVVATRFQLGGGTSTTLFEEVPDRVFIRRGVTGTTTETVDLLSATESVAPLVRELAVTNIISGEALDVSSMIALTTSLVAIAQYNSQSTPVSGTLTAPFYAVPASQLNNGEAQLFIVAAEKAVGSTIEARSVVELFTSPVDRSLALGPSLGPVSVTGSSRPTATYTVQNEYDSLFEVVFSQIGAAVSVLATQAYLDSSVGSTITLAVPNLSGVSGFDPSWIMIPGLSSEWHFFASDASLATLSSSMGAERRGSFTP